VILALVYFSAIVNAVNISMQFSDDEVTRLAEWADYLSAQTAGDLGVSVQSDSGPTFL
jgi:hypothetical protein